MFSDKQVLELGFTLDEDAKITGVTIEHIANQQQEFPQLSVVALVMAQSQGLGELKASGFLQSTFQPTSDARGDPETITFDNSAQLSKGNVYVLSLEVAEPDKFVKLYGSIEITYKVGDQTKTKLLPPAAFEMTPGVDFSTSFIPQQTGVIKGIALNRIVDLQLTPGEKQLIVTLTNNSNPPEVIATGMLTDTFLPTSDVRGDGKWVAFDKPVALDQTQVYTLHIQMTGDRGALAIYNTETAIESTWDDAIPLSMNGYNNFGYDDGIYGNILNFEMYWDDNTAKLTRMEAILDQTDTIFITSNRQWGTIPRVPERYPLSTVYYRDLIGCPDSKDLLKCYQDATPGMYTSKLGFDLVAVFQSNPNIGKFPDQRPIR